MFAGMPIVEIVANANADANSQRTRSNVDYYKVKHSNNEALSFKDVFESINKELRGKNK